MLDERSKDTQVIKAELSRNPGLLDFPITCYYGLFLEVIFVYLINYI